MKKILLSLLMLATLCFSLFSCKVPGTTPPGKQEAENLIYNADSELYFVYDTEKFEQEEINDLMDPFFGYEISPRIWSADELPKPHEIVVGNVGRPISNTAYSRLERMDKNSEDDGRFVIYSDGSSVCIAYDEEYGDFTRKIALDYFVNNYISGELILAPGVAHQESFNIPEYLGEQDALYYEQAWGEIADILGPDGDEVVSALKAFYSLLDGEAVITWLVGQFDPSICMCHALEGKNECEKTRYCGGAGFYYARSSRDNIGFMPDAESTAQALGLITGSGIAHGLSVGGYKGVIPKEYAEKICHFIYNLQDSDGFWYHPQWGKEISDNRRGRDNSWCTDILATYGVAPKYPTVASYDYKSESALPGALGNSSVAAVSKVIRTSDSENLLPEHLQSLDNFKKYVEELDLENMSYNNGNLLSAQASQIQKAGKEYVQVIADELLRIYNMYNNGTFHHTVNYYAINGVMKLIGFLNYVHEPIPDEELTVRACFDAISSDEPVKDIVDLWNTWTGLRRVFQAIISSDPQDGPNRVSEIKEALYPEYAGALRVTRDKLSLFRKDDGSFSYNKGKTSTTSQGAHVSMAGVDEGDVNATIIGTSSFTAELFVILEDYGIRRLPFALTRERYIFYKLLQELEPIEKKGTNADIGIPLDFDFDDVGYAPSNVSVRQDASTVDTGVGASVIEDPREGHDGNIMKYVSHKGVGDWFSFPANGLLVGATAQTFEAEICFEQVNGHRLFRLEFGSGTDNSSAYRMQIRVNGNKVLLEETSGRDAYPKRETYLGLAPEKGEWFKLRVEYYYGDHDSVRIKVYYNDKLAVVSDEYYNYNGVKITEGRAEPNKSLTDVRFYMLIDSEVSVLLDNVHVYNHKSEYKVEPLAEEFKDNKNVDARLLVEEGIEPGKRLPVMELEKARVAEGEDTTLSTLDLINKPVLIIHFNNDSKASLANVDKLLKRYADKMAVYAVCSTEYDAIALEGHIKQYYSESKIYFVKDVRAEGAAADTYYTAIGGSGADQRIVLLNKDGIVDYVSDAAFDIDVIEARLIALGLTEE